MYGSYRSGHRRSSVPDRAGSCGCPYYRGCKASLLFISSAVCSRLAKKCKNTKNSGVILRILILEYWLSIPHWLAQGFYCLLTKDVRCPYHMVGRFPEMHNDPLLLPISLRAWTGRGGGYFRNFWVEMYCWDTGTLNLCQSLVQLNFPTHY